MGMHVSLREVHAEEATQISLTWKGMKIYHTKFKIIIHVISTCLCLFKNIQGLGCYIWSDDLTLDLKSNQLPWLHKAVYQSDNQTQF
jgi:hypothetical protein